MNRDLFVLAATVWLLGAAAPAAPAASGFDARRDAFQVSDCVTAYKLLEEAALGLSPEVFQPYEDRHVVSWNRIRPFATASARALGGDQFYRHITAVHFAQERLLESNAITDDGVRNSLVLSLAAEAKACDKLVIGWGPPPKVPE